MSRILGCFRLQDPCLDMLQPRPMGICRLLSLARSMPWYAPTTSYRHLPLYVAKQTPADVFARPPMYRETPVGLSCVPALPGETPLGVSCGPTHGRNARGCFCVDTRVGVYFDFGCKRYAQTPDWALQVARRKGGGFKRWSTHRDLTCV